MPTYRKLQIGDMSDNGQITIVDQDRLCYIVKSESRGASGLRTISKALLSEFVSYIEKYPDANGNEAKEALSGKSNIDKFEYGYNATYVVMAKMVLGLQKIITTHLVEKTHVKHTCRTLQQIYYGAPGTGKSHIINQKVSNESVIRTTFHPDSDYSTFVGCYKPTTKCEPRYTSYGDKAMVIRDEKGNVLTEDRIVYEFVEQAFLQAYIQAWKFYGKSSEEIKKQFLVIEEINRGNCAQIFGDLFQLLDRNMWGFSDYPIQADNDMRKQLAKAFSGLEISQENKDRINACYRCDKDYVQQVLNGEILLLPDNLYIWATMNTSDQSLFPIDSAFKRRWDWQYMPIAKGRDNGKNLNWSIVAKDNEYDWWSFLTKINEQIGSTTNSEDKKLGFFFCKAVNGKISAETFVGKVIFYLWNDVFKDFGFDSDIFNDEDESTLSFDKFYSMEGGKVVVQKNKVEKFLKNLGVEVASVVEADEESDEEDEETKGGDFTSKHLKVTFPDGKIIEHNNSTKTFIEVINSIGASKVATLGIMTSGYKMLSKERITDDGKGYAESQRKVDDGYWLFTKLNTSQKKSRIQDISRLLDLGLKVDIVGNEDESEEKNDILNGKKEHKESLVAITVNGKRFTAAGITQFDLYLNALKEIGIDKVAPVIESMKYKRKGSKMATKIQVDQLLDSEYSYIEVDGYYFVKGANSYTLIRILEDLKRELKLDIDIEYK